MRVLKATALAIVLVLAASGLVACSGNGDSASEEQAPITFIQFYDPECPFCQEMEPIVERLQEEYEPRIDSFQIINIKTDEGRQMVEEFGVFLTPTFVILDENGDELDRINGAATEETMVDFVERAISDVTGGDSSGPREPIEGEGSSVE